MIATKTANSFFAGIAQLSSYAFLGALKGELWLYGIFIGIGAIIGNIIGKNLLQKMSDLLFRQLVIVLMVVSGIILIIKAIILDS